MIIEEYVDGRVRRYSDMGVKLRQIGTGFLYDDAVEEPGLHTYEETDIPVSDIEIGAEDALNILLGGMNND